MSIIYAICRKKQSGWILDYSLSNECTNQRICANCFERLDSIKNNCLSQPATEAVEFFSACLSTDISDDAKAIIGKCIEEHNHIIEEEHLKKEKEEQERLTALRIEQEKNEELERQRILREEQMRNERERQYHIRLTQLKKTGVTGYYEYKVISLADIAGLFKADSGRVNIQLMTTILNELGLDGWHLVTAYSNELGKNALSGGLGGMMLGVNSTIDENILIFERFVKIQ